MRGGGLQSHSPHHGIHAPATDFAVQPVCRTLTFYYKNSTALLFTTNLVIYNTLDYSAGILMSNSHAIACFVSAKLAAAHTRPEFRTFAS